MSFGKLYSYKGNARTGALLAVIKENNLDVELVETNPFQGVSDDYLLLNRLGRIPTFQGKDNFVLTECIAIAVYLTSQNEKTTLLGKTKQDYASILRWMSFFNSEVLPTMAGWFRPYMGLVPFNKKSVDDSKTASLKALKVLEDHFLVNTYLVGERVTLADIFAMAIMARGYTNVLDKKFAEEHPNLTRWYTTVYHQPIYSSVAPEFKIIDVAPTHPPKQEKKEEQAKKQAKKQEPKPKAAVAAVDDDEEPEEKKEKPKHPLEQLPKATFVLDEWKRQYSNHETREEALPWFWKNVNFEEYSLWKVDYKYNEELTQVFMSSNLIGGFFARLEASRKYIFGCASVYGENNNSIIQGAFLIRGQEALPAFDVAPDYESYEFKKLDPKSAEDRAFVEDQWSWDKPITVGGKAYEHGDGKVFK